MLRATICYWTRNRRLHEYYYYFGAIFVNSSDAKGGAMGDVGAATTLMCIQCTTTQLSMLL